MQRQTSPHNSMIHLVMEVLTAVTVVVVVAAVVAVGEDTLQIFNVKYVTNMVILHLSVTTGLTMAVNPILHSLYMILQIKEILRLTTLVKISILVKEMVLVKITMDRTMGLDHQIHGVKVPIRTGQCKTIRINSLQVQWLQTLILTQTGTPTTWIQDSGASFHVTGESQNIQQLSPFEGPDQIYIGNGQGLPIHSTGSSTFISPINSKVSLSLNQLLHVPTITKNLISVSKFALDNGVYFEFHPNHCLVKSQGANEILLKASPGP